MLAEDTDDDIVGGVDQFRLWCLHLRFIFDLSYLNENYLSLKSINGHSSTYSDHDQRMDRWKTYYCVELRKQYPTIIENNITSTQIGLNWW